MSPLQVTGGRRNDHRLRHDRQVAVVVPPVFAIRLTRYIGGIKTCSCISTDSRVDKMADYRFTVLTGKLVRFFWQKLASFSNGKIILYSTPLNSAKISKITKRLHIYAILIVVRTKHYPAFRRP
ncbi:hypothetical protein Y032_0141g2237 [Ancylostoma ceylanicum]|uniref:Uncharacterized protein n=1 Tax=Ancylostoma ceylanicum TaxID=53326 RepID=A0A016T427_9BILA|nr:hypothetical protein Y032_0141g2237 [Ancylostoma ceylanicum]